MDQPMRLSTAIRVGAKMRAASERSWTDFGPDGQIRSCALVAAAEAAGLFTILGNCMIPGPNWLKPYGGNPMARDPGQETGLTSRMPDKWTLVTSAIEIPPCSCRTAGVADEVVILIWHLHDIHNWSREAVAEWIETIETEVEARLAKTEALRQQLLRDEDLTF